MLFPYRRPELFSQNSVSKHEIAGVPAVTIVAAVYSVFLLSVFYLWATESVYGLNNIRSVGFITVLFALSGAIYLGMRYYRSQEGVDLDTIQSEIPKD
jgi:hypothetical protein